METLSIVRPQACREPRALAARVRLNGLRLFVLLVSCPAFAQNLPAFGQKGSWDLGIWVAGETGEENTNSFAEAQIWSAGVFIGTVVSGEHLSGWRRGNLEYAFDLVPVFETFGNQRTHGRGFDPVILRWNSVLHTPRISSYIELAGGVVITKSNLPPGNTSSFNFTPKGGGGIYLWTRKRQALDIGFRWSHISNANLGVDNPEFNGVQLSLAYHWLK
jgi:lipid A 3-O-deacylase